jgi:DNA-binding Lrp family transcriptional regulator
MGITSLKSTLAGILNRNKQKRKKEGVKSFSEKRSAEEAVERSDLGLKPVPVHKIVGSVGKYREFDSRFRLKEDHEPFRLKRIKEAMLSGKSLQPVELYKIKEEYYVLDGNHRVAAANEFGWKEIEAHVTEYLPSKKTLQNILYREKADFEKKTGLTDLILLTEVGQFHHLLEQITQHQHSLEEVTRASVSLESAAEDWYKTIYRPLVSIIKHSGLAKAFQRRTLADLYTYISFHHWQKGRKKRKYGIGLDQLIPPRMEEFRAKMMDKKESDFPEMKRGVTAFLMMNVETGRENRIMERLFAYKEVQEVHFIPGDFDILAKIVVECDLISSDSEAIGQFIQNRIRRIQGVTKTQTIIPLSSKRKEHPKV